MGYMFTSQLKRWKLKYHVQFALVVGVLCGWVILWLVVANYPLSHFLSDLVKKRVLDGTLTKMSPYIYIYILKDMLFKDEQYGFCCRILYSQLDRWTGRERQSDWIATWCQVISPNIIHPDTCSLETLFMAALFTRCAHTNINFFPWK